MIVLILLVIAPNCLYLLSNNATKGQFLMVGNYFVALV